MSKGNQSQAKRQAEKLEAWAKVGFASREVMSLRKQVNATRQETKP